MKLSNYPDNLIPSLSLTSYRRLLLRVRQLPMFLIIAFLFIAACDKDENSGSPANQQALKDSLDNFFLQPQATPTVFINVNVISMTSEELLTHRDVFVADGKIETILESGSRDYSSYLQVNGTDKYLIPGLTDMHTHPIVSDELPYDLFLFMAQGVTTIRVMWGFDGHVSIRDLINAGDLFGPQLYVASAGFDGANKSWPGAINTYSVSDVKNQIDEFSDKNYDFIKIYSGINSTEYAELIDYAWQKDIPPIGHVPNGVDIADAISKQHSISHLGKFLSSDLNDNALYGMLANSSTAVCPTLTVLNRIRGRAESYKGDWYEQISPEAREFYNETAHTLMASDSYALTVSRVLKKINDSGGLIIAGSDMGIRFVLPGTSLHEELEHYTAAGIGNFETLKTATFNCALFMSDELSGTIESNHKADLVLLNANPLIDITNTRNIAGVMKNGRWVSQSDIDKVLSWIRDYYDVLDQ